MLIDADSISSKSENLGQKTIRLAELKKIGLDVPPFLALDSTILKDIYKDNKFNEEKIDDIVSEIRKKLSCNQYAVRSSALNEDSSESSQAGQFKTEINLKPEDLSSGLKSVIEDADSKIKDISQFSLMIQDYIEPDCAGVTFTRDPFGGRETVVNYFYGRGEELVSGRIKPEELRYFSNEKVKTDLPGFEKIKSQFKKIEEYYKFPQDIEWCIKGGKWFFLQTRPITSLNSEDYQSVGYLDKILPTGDFLYEKTELTEIAPRTSVLTYELFKRLYTINGPIQSVYEEFGINYNPVEFLKIIGNELYVDRELELQTLFKDLTYLKSDDYRISSKTIFSLFTMAKNTLKFNTLLLDHPDDLFKLIKEKLENELNGDFSTRLKRFMDDYKLVFKINLLSEKALKSVLLISQRENVSFSDLLLASEMPDNWNIDFDKREFSGNSIDFADDSVFTAENKMLSPGKYPKAWPEWKLNHYSKTINLARRYERLREYGRWLVVKEISGLRKELLEMAKKLDFKIISDIYFATLPEILNQKVDEKLCINRKEEFNQYNIYHFPQRLTGRSVVMSKNLLGVSSGKGQGKLVEEKDIDRIEGDKILYVKTLSPSLTAYFNKIEGIVSESGGLLSHLAIIAREKSVPVVVNFNLNEKIKIGDKIIIDGASGDVHWV